MPIKQVLLGGQILHGEDRSGQWIVEKLTGWYDAPASKGDGGSRDLADGDYEYPQHYSARMITVDGILFHKGRGVAVAAMERLSAQAKLTSQSLVVTDFGLSRNALVKSLGVDFDPPSTEAVRFQVRLKAVDPFKYGESYSVGGSSTSPASVYHRGTVPAWPEVAVAGSSAGGYTLTLNGKSVVVTRPLVSGVGHSVDFRTGILRVGGVVVRGGLSTANFSPINPGLAQSMSLSAGSMFVRYSDTYI